jgi:NTE family protein
VNPLRDVVEEFFDFKLLRQARDIKGFICATALSNGQLKVFSLPEISLRKVLASACLPSLFHAVEVEGEYYWDGGFLGNPAIYPLIYNCDTPDIIIVQITTMHRHNLPLTAGDISNRNQEITFNACLMREMRVIGFITELMEQGFLDASHIKKLNVHLIQNDDLFRQFDFSQSLNSNNTFLEFLFKEGQKTAKEWISKNYSLVGDRSSIDLKATFC